MPAGTLACQSHHSKGAVSVTMLATLFMYGTDLAHQLTGLLELEQQLPWLQVGYCTTVAVQADAAQRRQAPTEVPESCTIHSSHTG